MNAIKKITFIIIAVVGFSSVLHAEEWRNKLDPDEYLSLSQELAVAEQRLFMTMSRMAKSRDDNAFRLRDIEDQLSANLYKTRENVDSYLELTSRFDASKLPEDLEKRIRDLTKEQHKLFAAAAAAGKLTGEFMAPLLQQNGAMRAFKNYCVTHPDSNEYNLEFIGNMCDGKAKLLAEAWKKLK